MQVSSFFTINWTTLATSLTDKEVNTLFEAFNYFPVRPEFTVRSGLIGLGKSRVLIQNQDQLRDRLFEYIEELNAYQQTRVKELVCEWIAVSTEVTQFEKAERVNLRIRYPEEKRALILKRLQTYIPIFRVGEVPEDLGGTGFPASGQEFLRG